MGQMAFRDPAWPCRPDDGDHDRLFHNKWLGRDWMGLWRSRLSDLGKRPYVALALDAHASDMGRPFGTIWRYLPLGDDLRRGDLAGIARSCGAGRAGTGAGDRQFHALCWDRLSELRTLGSIRLAALPVLWAGAEREAERRKSIRKP